MLTMEEQQEGRTWVPDEDTELTNPGASEPPNFFSCKIIYFPYCIICLGLGFCDLEPNASCLIHGLRRETPFRVILLWGGFTTNISAQ